jgi:transcriptional regulator with XRE-family HTH domain
MTTRATTGQGKRPIADRLREVIRARDLPAHRVAVAAGVSPSMIRRFLDDDRDIRLGTADKLATALGLRLVEGGGAELRTVAKRPKVTGNQVGRGDGPVGAPIPTGPDAS